MPGTKVIQGEGNQQEIFLLQKKIFFKGVILNHVDPGSHLSSIDLERIS